MKKGILLTIVMLLCLMAQAQNKKIKIALAVKSDSTFTLMGSVFSRSFDINLNNSWLDYFKVGIDTSSVLIKQEALPVMLAEKVLSDGSTNLEPSEMQAWMKDLKKQGYDYLIYIYRPTINDASYKYLEGVSYGINIKRSIAFSLNDACIYDLAQGKQLLHTDLRSSSDFMLSLSDTKYERKQLKDYRIKDIEPAFDLIKTINQQYAAKIWQYMNLILKRMPQ